MRIAKQVKISMQTRKNWIVDAAAFVGGLVAALSGVYFLFLPSGGYQGGRNPMYGVTILFERHTWGDLHMWGGIAMIAAISIHFAMHWQWVKRMAGRSVEALRPKGMKLSRGGVLNVAIDALVALSFLACALSGVYFLFAPTGGFQGGHNPGWDPGFLFSRTTWDLVHTWSGVVMSIAAVLHFAIHWRWVKNVTTRFFLSLLPQPADRQPAGSGQPTLAESERV